ncbi:microcin C transport system permease protein [Prosthecobacter fusiformis]|uniref:Microcin C transport system permease protein n=1 Tax=Prosthecobacter fusiformis TaxID=48464 RepID=A0A4R7RR19_9BACT|nr:ABC transporter permease [Prosthecobacter fusiformis]TDU68004.1 microcin C transport system permease protein [Prosthecobacter fusiformis]
MRDYFIRRFLLILPTLIGATMVVYFITRMAPGGPVEAMMRNSMALSANRSMKDAGGSLSEEQKEQIKARFKLDKPYLIGYLMWLGALPDELDKRFIKFEEGKDSAPLTLKSLLPKSEWKTNNAYRVIQATVSRDGSLKDEQGKTVDGWKVTLEPEKQRAVIFRPQFDGLLQGSFGYSLRYNDSVWTMIVERMPISIFFGLASFLIMYSVCLPLGVLKAIKHRTFIDNASSLLIFGAYAIPSFALGSVLVVYVAARWGWFPSGGFTSENFADLGLFAKVLDLLHHAALPLLCYIIGSFALLTMMMKNNLMDNLAADYVRTAIAKGAGFKRAVLHHALRNSLIPVASTLGGVVMIFVGGSVLIERIFDINGLGMLHFQAVLDRDITLMMGLLTVDVFLIMIGNILSDYFVALADPRIRFD